MKKIISIIILSLVAMQTINAQVKILFDATKAETAGNADWVIDADLFNLGFGTGPAVVGGGTEANPARIPSPLQSTVTATTPETYWKGGISYWGLDCVKKGYQVETLPYNGVISYGNSSNVQDLSNYTIFVVVEPNIKFTATEKTAMLNFVFNGGRLFMVSDHTVSDRNNDGWDSPAIWNDFFTNNSVISNPFGIAVDLTNISGTSTVIANNPNDSLLHGSYGNVTEVKWSNGATLTINPTANPTVKASVYKSGSSNTGNTNVLVAYARYGAGKVVVVGDSSPFDDGTGDTNNTLYDGYITDAAGNHQKLIMNATVWLATSNTVTPVTLTNFTANQNNQNVLLQWQTETEINTTYFNIQQSFNNNNFETIGTVAAKGTGSNYSYNTAIANIPAQATTVYYRLQMVDKDGSNQYSPIKLVNIKHPISSITIYPIPAKSSISIASHNIASVQIVNSTGYCIKKINTTSNLLNIDIGFLANGLYFINAIDNNGNYTQKPFLKF